MPVLTLGSLDPTVPGHELLADFTVQTDVALRKSRGSEHGLYIAESALVVQRALRAGHRPRAILSLEASLAEVQGLLADQPSRTADVPIFTGTPELLAELTGYDLHRGIVASMERPALPDPADLLRDARRIVILENVADPTNVGAIFRSVAGIGADAVLVTPRCTDPFYRRAIRVSMGTVLQVPWSRVGDWPSTRVLLDEHGFHLAALALEPGAVSLRDFAENVPQRVALLLGEEGYGLTREAIEASDTIVQIPMAHGIDSLNVAATAAVAMWALA